MMSDEKEDKSAPQTEGEAKPTITIAEKEGTTTSSDAKPTITIAEKDGGK
jgi:hypothetical protein